jgi:hypothetical protein
MTSLPTSPHTQKTFHISSTSVANNCVDKKSATRGCQGVSSKQCKLCVLPHLHDAQACAIAPADHTQLVPIEAQHGGSGPLQPELHLVV